MDRLVHNLREVVFKPADYQIEAKAKKELVSSLFSELDTLLDNHLVLLLAWVPSVTPIGDEIYKVFMVKSIAWYLNNYEPFSDCGVIEKVLGYLANGSIVSFIGDWNLSSHQPSNPWVKWSWAADLDDSVNYRRTLRTALNELSLEQLQYLEKKRNEEYANLDISRKGSRIHWWTSVVIVFKELCKMKGWTLDARFNL